MRDELKKYVNSLFESAADSEEVRETRDEILQNTLDRYDDAVSSGVPPREAYDAAVAGLGDIGEVLEGFSKKDSESRDRSGGRLMENDCCYRLRGTVKTVKVRYPCGKVYIRMHGGEDVRVTEKNVEDGEEHSGIKWSNGELIIGYKNAGERRRFGFRNLGEVFSGKRSLEILVPGEQASSLSEVELHSASGDFEIINIGAEKLRCDTASGDVSAAYCRFERADFRSASGDWSSKFSDIKSFSARTASGDAAVKGTAEDVQCATASGNIQVAASNVPRKVRFDSASGDCKLLIPRTAEFEAELHSKSGAMQIGRFAGELSEKNGNTVFVCGDGRAKYSFNTLSGDASVHVNESAD